MDSLSLRNQHPGVGNATGHGTYTQHIHLALIHVDALGRRFQAQGGLWPFTLLGRWMVISSSLTRTVTTSYCYCSRRGYASGSAPLWLGGVMRRAAENESNWLISQITHPAVCRPSNGVGYHLRANLATVPKLITETAMLHASWRYFDGGTTCTSLR